MYPQMADVPAIKFVLGTDFWEMLMEGFCFGSQYFFQSPKTRFLGVYFLRTLGDAIKSPIMKKKRSSG
jgi:hypothetical protein